MKTQFAASRTFGLLLNALLPGAGHLLWHEPLFGTFVFLIMLLAAAVFIVHYLVPLPPAATWILLVLPMLFYVFTFVDLWKTMSTKRAKFMPSSKFAVVVLIIAVAYQVFSPSAPSNFLLRNFPDVFVVRDAHLNPLYRRGEIISVNRMAYAVELPFLRKPVLHSFPVRFDLVRYMTDTGEPRTGFVVGLRGEDVEIRDGQVIVNGESLYSRLPAGFVLSGEWPLTPVGSFSILVATFNLGTIERVEEVRLENLVGRVRRFS